MQSLPKDCEKVLVYFCTLKGRCFQTEKWNQPKEHHDFTAPVNCWAKSWVRFEIAMFTASYIML